jgi:hypothetical protein
MPNPSISDDDRIVDDITERRAPSFFCTRIFSCPQQSKIKLVGKAVLSLPSKLLKIQYALVVHLSPKAHLPLRTVALIFL